MDQVVLGLKVAICVLFVQSNVARRPELINALTRGRESLLQLPGARD